jgi:hypothetical protein
MSHRFDIRHCTNMLHSAERCLLYVKLPVVEVSVFIGSDRIISSSRVLPILYSDVQGHYFKLPSFLVTSCAVTCATYQANSQESFLTCIPESLQSACSVYDTCSKLGTFRKWLGSTVCVLVINGSIISIHS